MPSTSFLFFELICGLMAQKVVSSAIVYLMSLTVAK